MLNFDERTGPAPGVGYPDVTVPDWYRDTKLGVFTHWDIFSLPAWAEPHDGRVPVEDAYTRHRYAGWYGNTVRIPVSPCRVRHVMRFGEGTNYRSLADRWRPDDLDADAMIRAMLRSGARRVVPMTKHHDGFCLWDTATTSFNAARRGPGRNLIRQLADTIRAAGARFGVYFPEALDWHVSDLPPIQSDRDLFLLRRNDEGFARYAVEQLTELIDRFRLSVLWNDIEWSDGDERDDGFGVAALWRHYLETVPDGVVNDCWGVPAHGFLTREYSDVDGVQEQVWEATRELGLSFGYNAEEDKAHSLDVVGLTRYFVDVVAENDNLLTNVGPRADGSISQLQQRALDGLRAWLEVSGTAIFRSRPWRRATDGEVRYTVIDGVVHAFLLSPASGELRLPAELAQVESVA